MPRQPAQSSPGHPLPNDAPVGDLLRHHRTARALSLQRLADLAGCTKSYLSSIETGRRVNPPGDDLLLRLESALDLPAGTLLSAARWQTTHPEIKLHIRRLQLQQSAAHRPHDVAPAAPHSRDPSPLDALYRSGRLKALVDQLAAPLHDVQPAFPAPAPDSPPISIPLPAEVPLINSVAAGYPTEFTDLGYPARIADEYIRSPDISDPDAFAARVVGDSMLPEYRQGDIVIFSPARPVRSGADCFVRLEPDHESTFKRVFFEADDSGAYAGFIRLQPLNSAYAPRTVPRELVAGLYAAVSVTRAIDV